MLVLVADLVITYYLDYANISFLLLSSTCCQLLHTFLDWKFMSHLEGRH